MATFYSNLYAAPADGSSGYSYKGPYGSKSGETVSVVGTFTCPAALATNDIANLFPIPAGAKVLRHAHFYEDFGTTCTTTVQCDSTDMKASIALGTAVTVANIADLTAAEYAAAHAVNLTAEKNINLIFTSVSAPTAGKVYNFFAQYAMP